MSILYRDLSYDVVGCAMKVHNTLGCGFMEKVYQEALAIQLEESGIPFEREKRIWITYHDRLLQCPYVADFVIDNKIILEVKALSVMDVGLVKAQVINYLKASRLALGIILNFGAQKISPIRVVNVSECQRKGLPLEAAW